MAPDKPKAVPRSFFVAWSFFFMIWLATSASLQPASLVCGLMVTFGVTYLATSRTSFWDGLDFGPTRLLAGVQYIGVFLREMVKSNIAVLGYVYDFRRHPSPGIVSVPTRLVGARERLALTNTIALTPGTLAIDLDGETVEIHVLDANLVDGAKEGVTLFEPLLEKALG